MTERTPSGCFCASMVCWGEKEDWKVYVGNWMIFRVTIQGCIRCASCWCLLISPWCASFTAWIGCKLVSCHHPMHYLAVMMIPSWSTSAVTGVFWIDFGDGDELYKSHCNCLLSGDIILGTYPLLVVELHQNKWIIIHETLVLMSQQMLAFIHV